MLRGLDGTARAMLEARGLCEEAAREASDGDVVSATRLLFHAVLGRGGAIVEAARHLRTPAVMRTLMVCKQCVDAEQCPPGCEGDHPLHDEVRCAGFMLLCLQAVFAGDETTRQLAGAGAGRAVQGWVRHFPPGWAVKAELFRRCRGGGGGGGDASDGASASVGRKGEGRGEDANVGDGGNQGGSSYEGEAAAAVLLLSARDLLRGTGSGRDPTTEAEATAAAERAAEAARLATLAGKFDKAGAHPPLVRGLAHIQAHNFFLAALDLTRAAPLLPNDSPWAAGAWQRKVEALITAVAIGQWRDATRRVTAGELREAAQRGAAAAAAAAATFGTEGASAPCGIEDFGPMLAALEGMEDGDEVQPEAMRAYLKGQHDARARAAMEETSAVDPVGNGSSSRGVSDIVSKDGAGPSAERADIVGGEKLGVKAPPMPTATRLSFNKTCARPGCAMADAREAAKAERGLVACSYCEVVFWCSQECATVDWGRHRKDECRPVNAAPTPGGASR